MFVKNVISKTAVLLICTIIFGKTYGMDNLEDPNEDRAKTLKSSVCNLNAKTENLYALLRQEVDDTPLRDLQHKISEAFAKLHAGDKQGAADDLLKAQIDSENVYLLLDYARGINDRPLRDIQTELSEIWHQLIKQYSPTPS